VTDFAVTVLSFAAVDASAATAGFPVAGVVCGATGVVSARAHVGSLRGRGAGGGGGGGAAAVAPTVDVRVVVRANVGAGFPSETGSAVGGVGTIWRTSSSSVVSEATGVC
jgi:hypothetical protein